MAYSGESLHEPNDTGDISDEIREREDRFFDDLEHLTYDMPGPLAPIADQLAYRVEADRVRVEAEEIAELHKQQEAS